MYHGTPANSSDIWSVDIANFKAQIKALTEAGFGFLPFRATGVPNSYQKQTSISLTFDDGQTNNVDAFKFLYGLGIQPTSFIVSEWSRRSQNGSLSAATIRDLARICDFGAHGANHKPMALLSPTDLQTELVSPKGYLEEILSSSITMMALPGGSSSPEVLSAATRVGYTLIGNSVPLINSVPGHSINRVCVTAEMRPADVVRIAQAHSAFWMMRRAKRICIASLNPILGEEGVARVSRAVKNAKKRV
jgi:peptidoglycan/xylan/chitin deacetylase (PgdA/CDA1 family)